MAITFSSSGAGVSTETSGAALSPACPAVVAAGDILILQTAWEGTTSAPTDPAGWTLLFGPQDVGSASVVARHWVYGKIAVGDEDGAAIALGSPAVTTMRAARIFSFAGRLAGSITDLVNGFTNTVGDTDPTGPTVTTTRTGGLACALVYQNDNNTLETFASSSDTWTERGTAGGYIFALSPGGVLDLLTATPADDPGTVSGGAMTVANDPWSVIGFQIIDLVMISLDVASPTITVSENTEPVSIPLLQVNLGEEITVTEDRTLAGLEGAVSPSASSEATVTEDQTVRMSVFLVDPFESITVAEDTPVSIPVLPMDVFSAMTADESQTIQVSLYVADPTETVTIADEPTVSVPLLSIDDADAVTVADELTMSIPGLGPSIDVFDLVVVTDVGEAEGRYYGVGMFGWESAAVRG